MPSVTPKPRRARLFRVEQRLPFDAFIMFIYVVVVYGWGVSLIPLGRDYALLGGETGELPFILRFLWEREVALFGAWSAGYHILNIALMHGSMVCLYLFVNFTLRGPAWLGVLAANLFMANPLHTESLLNHAGMIDLLPCLLALGALAGYAIAVERASQGVLLMAMVVAAVAAAVSPQNAFLPALLLLYEALLTGSHRRSKKRIAASAVLLVGALAWHYHWLISGTWTLASQIVPLYFTVYCLGFLPETMARFAATPWMAWAAAASVILALWLIHRKARRGAVPFAIGAGLLLQLAPLARPIDPVHLIGGGQLLLPQALVMFAVAALYQRIMEHPRWRIPLIYSSFSVSMIFFAVAMISVFTWRDAAGRVEAFRAAAAALGAEETLAVLPDFQCYRGAPLTLSETIVHDTPFGPAIAAAGYMHIHLPAPIDAPWEVDAYREESAAARFSQRSAAAFRPWALPVTPDESLTIEAEGDDVVVTASFSGVEPSPAVRISLPSAGEEAGRESQPDTEDQHEGVEE